MSRHSDAENYNESGSSQPHELSFSAYTGYERTANQRRDSSDNEATRVPLTGSGGQPPDYSKAISQIHTHVPFGSYTGEQLYNR